MSDFKTSCPHGLAGGPYCGACSLAASATYEERDALVAEVKKLRAQRDALLAEFKDADDDARLPPTGQTAYDARLRERRDSFLKGYRDRHPTKPRGPRK